MRYGQDASQRMLIRGDNWRYRAHIAERGRLPDPEDIAERYQSDYAIARGRAYWDRSMRDEPLPAFGAGGYPTAYLEVYASDCVDLSRNEFLGGDATVCTACAEACRPDVGSEWGYYPLWQVNGEITGYNDMRVVRCERCDAIIVDYETLALVIAEDGEQTEERYDASDAEQAIRHYDAALARLVQKTDEPWSIALVDCERMLDGVESGEAWPLEIVAAMDSERCNLLGHIAGGQSQLPGFPEHPLLEQPDFPALFAPLPEWQNRHTAEYRAGLARTGERSPWLTEYIPYVPLVPLTIDAGSLFDLPSG